jgi:hypothetical protein
MLLEIWEDTSHLKHVRGGDSHIVLVFQLGHGPNDPLNWPQWQEEVIISGDFEKNAEGDT